jgi:hypothetical protein
MRQRIAVLADIHANVWALEAVLADVRKQCVDVLWNLGDILYGALKPRATYDLLRSTDIALTIRGNQDRELYEPNPDSRARWIIRDLGAEPIDWLRGLPATLCSTIKSCCATGRRRMTCAICWRILRAVIRRCAMRKRS